MPLSACFSICRSRCGLSGLVKPDAFPAEVSGLFEVATMACAVRSVIRQVAATPRSRAVGPTAMAKSTRA